MNVSSGEILWGIAAFAGAAAITIGAPYWYFGDKYHDQLIQKGEINNISYKIRLAKSEKYDLESFAKICNQKDEEEIRYWQRRHHAWNCRNITSLFTEAQNKIQILENKEQQYYSKLDKYRAWGSAGAYGAVFGTLEFLLSLSIVYESRNSRKKKERRERINSKIAEAKKLKDCSSLDERLYCTEMAQPHLDGAEINYLPK